MTRQPVRLIVDSTMDVPLDWLRKWEIPIVPAFVNIGQESIPDDGVTLDRSAFYHRMAGSSETFKTSAMPQGLAMEAYERELERADHLIVFCVSAEFSSIHNTMKLAAQKVSPERIHVVETGAVTLGAGWQAVAAAEVAAQGGDLETALKAAQSVKERGDLFALIDNLEFLRRSGRISSLVAGIGSLLQIKPILQIKNGIPVTAQRTRTLSRAKQSLIDMIKANAPLERLAILHTASPDGAQDILHGLGDAAPKDTLIVEATPAIGVHVGPGCLGAALVRKL